MDMTADDMFRSAQRKGRSASICAPSFSSMEAMVTAASTPPDSGTPSSNRRTGRRPATRSHSARMSGANKSVRPRPAQEHHHNTSMRSGNSEPRLNHHGDSLDAPRIGVTGASGSNTPESSPAGVRRRPAGGRRASSMHHAHTGTVHRDHHQHRKSTAFLDVPDLGHARGPDEDEDSYRLRSFSATSKGVVNRGDSFRRRRSRSNSLLPADATPLLRSPAAPAAPTIPTVSDHDSYRVAMLGARGVGKSALISQFMTSECINAYDRQRDIPKEQSVSIMLNGEESELQFINISNTKELENGEPCAALVMMYSVVDKASFQKAEQDLQRLQEIGMLRNRAVIMVGTKVDLARSRAISTQDGKCLACTYKVKFIEISVGINHNVDELLVGILSQIRLKATLTEREGGAHWYKNRGVVRASMKARQMFTWIFGKEDSKFKNCENLNVA
ncbi:GTP-binding protein REM 1 isoform X2 [Frankliniella occidentalis]|uniref:GTP-binding protein REM 1 isoform X2 n=1 Tax=Frankliniella occidentalis TaxID=133901 RepID=A0A6J1RXN6_FRAOC|nr:GTP-binding protein REM 1 isoform X2 [Frankliniella occidentalis]